MLAFRSATDAVACAVEIQRAEAAYRRPGRAGFGVRVGVHTGDALEEEDDYFGAAVVLAERLCGQAEPDTILTSAVVMAPVGSTEEVRFQPAGRLALRGLAAPVAGSPPVRARAPGRDATLSSALSRKKGWILGGRQSELTIRRESWRRAASGARSVVFVSGEPGIGKPRIAAQLAQELHS